MRVKNVIKVVMALCLSAVLMFSLFGCSGESTEEKGDLPNQTKNRVFYFQQGYKDGWDLIGDPEGDYSVAEEVLIVELKPQADAETVCYSVHKMGETEWVPMTSSLEKITELVLDSESELYFNKIAGVRENFKFTAEKYTYEVINGNQYSVIPYSYTENGADWQGELHILTHGREFFMITFEATTDKYATYETDFDDMLKDFRKLGYETAEGIS